MTSPVKAASKPASQETEASFSPVRSEDHDNPFGFDESPAPPQRTPGAGGKKSAPTKEKAFRFDEDEFDDEDSPRGRRQPAETGNLSDLRTTWGIARAGIRVTAFSAIVVALCQFAIVVSGTMALLFMGPVNFAAPPPMPLTVYWLVAMGCSIVSIVAALGHFIGQILCCWTPRPYNRGAVNFLILLGVTIVTTVVVVVGAAMSSRGNPYETGKTIGMISVFTILPLGIATLVSWFNFLRLAALKFRGSGVRLFLTIIMYAMPALMALKLIVTQMTRPELSSPWDIPVIALVFGFFDFLMMGAYAVALFMLSRQMTRGFAGEVDPPTKTATRRRAAD